MRGAADRQALYRHYISHYTSRSHEGDVTLYDRLLPCDPPATSCDPPATSCDPPATSCDPPATSCDFYLESIREMCVRSPADRRSDVLRRTMKGFAILELICVNLFLFPWRKEIRTLKKFTGNFIYFVEPVMNKDMVSRILQKVGYSIATDTEYIIGGKINPEDAKQTAFELFLARSQCEELMVLIQEGRADCVNLFIHGHPSEGKSNSDTSGEPMRSDSNGMTQEDINDMNDTSAEDLGNQDNGDAAAMDEAPSSRLTYTYNKFLDSDDFLNTYTDLNLAQQPIFPLHNKHVNIKEPREEWVQLDYEEPNPAKPHYPESSAEDPGLSQGKASTDEPPQIVDRPVLLSEVPVEFSTPHRQGHSERSVSKIKMENMDCETFTCPVQETLPPGQMDVTRNGDLCQWKPKWRLLDGNQALDSVSLVSCGFSIVKAAEGNPCAENKLREPPSSTYVPPGLAERQCLKITEENHFQPPSLWEEATLVSDMTEESREGFVMI